MKKLVIGVCGSIAAFKIANLLSIVRGKLNVQIVMTRSAQRFVGAQTFLSLTGNPVLTSLWGPDDIKPLHIDLADQLDAFMLAPASANMIGKLASGIADDVVSTLAISVLPEKKPFLVAPAMNTQMWQHPATKRNLALLQDWGMKIIPPDTGDLACGWQGEGRLCEPEELAKHLYSALELNPS